MCYYVLPLYNTLLNHLQEQQCDKIVEIYFGPVCDNGLPYNPRFGPVWDIVLSHVLDCMGYNIPHFGPLWQWVIGYIPSFGTGFQQWVIHHIPRFGPVCGNGWYVTTCILDLSMEMDYTLYPMFWTCLNMGYTLYPMFWTCMWQSVVHYTPNYFMFVLMALLCTHFQKPIM